jgi:hypothetical protein
MLRASSRSMTEEEEETGEPVSATGPKRKAAGRRKGKKRKANGGSRWYRVRATASAV